MTDSNTPMVYFYPDGHEAHHAPQHPERPERIEVIRRSLEAAGLWQAYEKVLPVLPDENVLFRIHSSQYLNRLKQACTDSKWFDQDTYLVPDSWDIALHAAGGAIAVARRVWSREANTGFALCRPPGHHATQRNAMGFCLLNNVALAAEDLLQNKGANRVAILDLDLHHGNGTQDIFYARGDVFYLSTHQWPLYPGTGRLEEQGVGDGFGTNANLPFPPGTGDEGFQTSLNEFILPLLDSYHPDILLVSAGFDSHWMDPLGFLQLTAGGYGKLMTSLKSWVDEHCYGRIAVILEGGYNLESIAACSQSVVSALCGEDFDDPLGRSPHRDTDRWKNTLEQAMKLWRL